MLASLDWREETAAPLAFGVQLPPRRRADDDVETTRPAAQRALRKSAAALRRAGFRPHADRAITGYDYAAYCASLRHAATALAQDLAAPIEPRRWRVASQARADATLRAVLERNELLDADLFLAAFETAVDGVASPVRRAQRRRPTRVAVAGSAALMDALDDVARSEGVSRAALAKTLLAEGLERRGALAQSDVASDGADEG